MKRYLFTALLLMFLPLLGIAQASLYLSITGYDANCNGSAAGSAKVIASGGTAPYTYTWASVPGTSDSVSGLAAGVYSVTVTDSAGSSASISVTINQPAPLTVYIDSIVVLPCFRLTGGSCGCFNTLWAVVSGGTPPYSYFWTPGDNTGDTVAGACYLEWTVNVTDHNSCISTDSLNVVAPSMVITGATGIAQVNSASGINLYPNPANTQLNISIDQFMAGAKSIVVYNILGEKVLEHQLNGNERLVTLDISRLAAGNYLLRMPGGASTEATHFTIAR